MGLYLYAITDRPGTPLPAVSGLGEARPFIVCEEGAAAVVSAIASEGATLTPSNLWSHERVIEALMEDRAVLPARFGTVLTGDHEARRMLVAHHREFVADLHRVRGRVEMGLRVLWCAPPIEVSGCAKKTGGGQWRGSGRLYLEARRRDRRRRHALRRGAQEMAARLHAPLQRLALDSRQRLLATPRLLLTASYLVEKDMTGAFGREIDALNANFPTVRALCTGPWPPYSFVTMTPKEAGWRSRCDEST